MIFSGDMIALAFYFSRKYKSVCMCRARTHTHAHVHTHKDLWSVGVRVHGKSLLSLSECSCSISHIHPHIYLSKLHVSCYLWWDSGELYDLSSFSLIIAIMRIKALKIAAYALLVVLFIHIHEDGRIWSLLGCQYINLGYLTLSRPLPFSRSFKERSDLR